MRQMKQMTPDQTAGTDAINVPMKQMPKILGSKVSKFVKTPAHNHV